MSNAVEQEESQLVAPVGHEEGEIPLVDDEIDDDEEMIFACTAPAGWSVSRNYVVPAPGTNVMVRFTPDEGDWSRATVKRAVTGTSGSFLVL